MKRSFVFLLHAGYWALYLLLLLFLLLAMNAGAHAGPVRLSWVLRMLLLSPFTVFTLVPGAGSFYLFYFLLFSAFLKRKRIIALVGFGLLGCIGISALASLSCVLLFGRRTLLSGGWSTALSITAVFAVLALVHGVIALVMRGFVSWYGDIRIKEELNRKNAEMELALVKSKISPHFLFNTINNIDVLIGKDPAAASAYLNKLSDIMRFMLYETRSEKIPLSKELSYIGKFVDLQRIRTSNADFVQYVVNGETGDCFIEPMLFIPFIENAFKHAENRRQGNVILIRFNVQGGILVFHCENRISHQAQSTPEHSGLGNELIRRRLSLLYPGKHTLEIRMRDGWYIVHLTLNRNED